MAEMLVKSESLTSIADKIRVLKGTTESMSLDDMETELGTVDNAVTAALSALVEKGVEVPEGTNVTGLAELIAAIETGVDPAPFSQILTGTFTPATTTRTYTIPEEAIGTVGFLILYKCESDSSAQIVVQAAYVNLGGLYSSEIALYQYTKDEFGTLNTNYPKISTDGRTFSFAKFYALGATTYGYAIGMVNR